jgi:hypothetical protein
MEIFTSYVALKKTTMKKLHLLTILVVLTGTIVIGQTRCDTISDDIFGVTEEMPTLNISIDQLEDILNISIDLNKYSRPEGNAIYVNLIINCKGEDFDYKVLKPVDKGLEKQLLSILETSMTWTPAKHLNKPVDFSKSFEIRLDENRFNILDEKERKRLNKKRK